MFIFLTLTSLLLFSLFVIVYHLTSKYQITITLREIILLSVMAIGLLIVFATEGLSLFTLLTPLAIKITWLTTIIVSAGSVIYLYFRRRESLLALGEEGRARFNIFKSQPWQVYFIFSLIVISIFATLITINQHPVPNTGDSMRYHLTRTLVWVQQASVRHFATTTLHQLSFPPFAEYVIMHVNILVGSDHLSRIVQWIAMLVCIVAVSEIAKKLGADFRQQVIAALLCISIPMVVVQSTNTMNDLVVAAWLFCFIAFGLRFKLNPRDRFSAMVTGLALGLALLTKSTAFIFALPFSIWVAVSAIRTEGFRLPVWKAGVVIILMVLLINTGHFTRNMTTFGTPLGKDIGTVNEVFSLRVLASNVIRNLQMHMPAVEEGNPEIINLLSQGIRKITWNLHELTGMDQKDSRTTYKGNYVGFDDVGDSSTGPGGFSMAEGRAGSFVHLVLIFFTIVFSMTRFKNQENKQYLLILIATFLLFSFLLKAQSPMNRLVMPYIVMWTPLIVLALSSQNRHTWLILPLLVWMLCLPWLLNTKSRPLIPNQERAEDVWPSEGIEAYFVRKPELLPVFEEATSIISQNQCSEIGIVFFGNNYLYEYPFWMMLREKGFTGTINHMMVSNESVIYEDFQFSPCLIFSNTELDNLPEYSLTTVIKSNQISKDYLIYTEN